MTDITRMTIAEVEHLVRLQHAKRELKRYTPKEDLEERALATLKEFNRRNRDVTDYDLCEIMESPTDRPWEMQCKLVWQKRHF